MKRIFSLILACLMALLCAGVLFGCSDEDDTEANGTDEIVYHTVTFNSNGGSAVPSVQVPHKGKVTEPPAPTLENHVFQGWMYDGVPWSFTKGVTEDITLVASWEKAEESFEYKIVDGSAVIVSLLEVDKEDVIIPSTIAGFTVTTIGESAFAGSTAETTHSITVPNTVTRVEDYAFQNCEGITISLSGARLSYVGENAFEGCDGLVGVSFANGITEIAPSAFLKCSSLTVITLPSTVTVIGESAFEGCTKLVSLLFSSNVTEIGHSAFRDCESLKTLLFEGDRAQFETVLTKIHSVKNEALLNLSDRVCLYSETEPTDDGSYWHYDEGGNPKVW